MPGRLAIQLLGGFRILHGDETFGAVHSARLQSLITYLVLHPDAYQNRQHLATLFWPDSTEGQARTNVRKLVFELRRALPGTEQYLQMDDRGLLWRSDTPAIVDIDEFARAIREGSPTGLERAVDLYRGDLLPECYDDWIIPHRERLRQACVDALERLIVSPPAIRYARRLLDLDALHEATYRMLMRLHALTGDRTGAVRVYHACATRLQRELGVTPSPATRETYERLLAVDAQPAAQPLAAPPLVGRHDEWEILQEAWRTGTSRQPWVVLLRGEAGIGKTRLAEDLLEWAARQGIANARARCYAAETDLAYAPAASLLRSRALPPLAPVWKREIARLLPEVAAEDSSLPSPEPLAEAWQRQRLFEALARVLLVDQPLLIVVDDLQWCDESSLEWLHHLVHHNPQARLLFVGTLRHEEVGAGHPLERSIASWRQAGVLTEVDLQALDAQTTVQLAASISGDLGEAAGLVFKETEGNPLFIVEMARAGLIRKRDGAATLPSRIQEVIRTRLAHLSEPAHSLAGIAATVGRSFTYHFLAQVTGWEDEVLIGCLDELWQRRIVREQGAEAYDFSHDKLREVAYGELSAAKRRQLHRKVAEALEGLHAADLDAVGGQIAVHFEQAGLLERAVPHYMRAAEAALRIYANDVAVNYFHRLLALERGVDRIAVMSSLGEIWQRTGRWTDAEQIYRRALALAQESGDAEAQARCQIGLGFTLRLRGVYGEATTWLHRAREAFERLGAPRGLSRAVGHLGVVYFELAEYDRALACFEQQRQLAEHLGDISEMSNALRDMGLVYWLRGDYAKSLACHERQLELAGERGERSGVEGMNAVNNLGSVYRALGQFDRALEHFRESLRIAKDIGHRRGVAVALGNIAIVHEEQGDYQHALYHLGQQLEIATALGDRRGASVAIWHMGNVFEAMGSYPEALQCFARQLSLGIELQDNRVAASACANVARVHAARGLQYEAITWYEQSLAELDTLKLPRYLCETRYRLADLYLRAGRLAEARREGFAALELAARLQRTPFQYASEALLIRVRLALREIEPDAAERELRQLLVRYPDLRQQAAGQYELWRLTRSEDSRQAAATLYRQLFTAIPRIEYRQRYETLTGDALPPPPPLPPPPEMVMQPALDLDDLRRQAVSQSSGTLPKRHL